MIQKQIDIMLRVSKMADVVINSLGDKTWDRSFESIGINGRLGDISTVTH
jgi:NADPH:quinone reductase-like Zn-dependent oxidoreductase